MIAVALSPARYPGRAQIFFAGYLFSLFCGSLDQVIHRGTRLDNIYTDLRRSSSGQFATDLFGEIAFHPHIILLRAKCPESRLYKLPCRVEHPRPQTSFHHACAIPGYYSPPKAGFPVPVKPTFRGDISALGNGRSIPLCGMTHAIRIEKCRPLSELCLDRPTGKKGEAALLARCPPAFVSVSLGRFFLCSDALTFSAMFNGFTVNLLSVREG